VSDTKKIPFALGAADSYLRMAEVPYAQLSERWRSRTSGGQQAPVSNPGELSPLVSNVGFGIELLLKVLRIQDSSAAPRGHKLLDLFSPLHDDVRRSLESRYTSHLTIAEKSDGAPYVLFNLKQITPAVDVTPAATVQGALKNMNRAFEEWRYMYELENLPSGVLYFNFFESIAVAKALRAEISEFKCGAVVRFERA